MTKHQGFGFLVAACAVVLVACPAPHDASSSNAANQGLSCTRVEDCVVVRGDPCNRCGSCPGDEPGVTSAAEAQRAQKDPGCAARLGSSAPVNGVPPPPPNCSPCAGGQKFPTAHAACIDDHCVLRCTDVKVVGDRTQETEVVCHD